MKKTALFAALALALAVLPHSAAAQRCPASTVGQSCDTGAGPGGWWGTGICVASTCGSLAPDGAASEEPCGFCEPVACPVTQVGQACEAGTCTQASCLAVDDAGSATRRTCAVCASPPPDGCAMSDVGKPCGDGGVCTAAGTRTYGPAGAHFPSQLSYPIAQCIVPVSDDAGEDAGVTLSLSTGDGSADAGSAGDSGAGAARSAGSSGCALSAAGGATGPGGLLLASAALSVALSRRRRGRS